MPLETERRSARRFLVVDDDPDVRSALERLLRSHGLQATTFASAEELLAAGVGAGPATLILDVRLPGMSGMELLHLLASGGSGMLRILMISAAEDPAIRAAALAGGAGGWFSKPIECKALLAAATAENGAGSCGLMSSA